jgi:Rho GTPase-activating protein RGD1
MSAASDAYRKAVLETQTKRQEYFNFQLPRLLRALKECVDEIDLGTQYHLTRYAYLFESIVLNDGSTLVPTTSDEGPYPLFHYLHITINCLTHLANPSSGFEGDNGIN